MPDDTLATESEAPVENTDTAENQPSQTSEQDIEAPEATQEQAEVKETEAPETKAEDTAEETLLAGKYKSVEDLEKSYKELASKYGRETSEKAELAKILNEALLTPEQTPVSQEALDSYEESDPVTTELDKLNKITAIQTFLITHPDANPESLTKVIQEDPMIQRISDNDAKLEYAYLRSQNMTQKKAIVEAEKKGAQAAQAKTAEKQVAQVESAKKAAPADEGAELMSTATSGNAEERRLAREALIRKHLVKL